MSNKKYTVSIIDHSGIQQTLNFDFRNHQVQNLYFDVRALMKQLFEDNAEMISRLFPQKEITFAVHLEQEKAENSGTVLACFDAGKSEGNVFYFHVYYTTIQRIAQYIIDPSDSYPYSEISKIIVHELIHAADLTMLKENISIAELGYKLYGTDNHNLLRDVDSPDYKWDIQNALLRYFQIFRNEGVAILGEKLLSIQSGPMYSRGMDDVIDHFKDDLSHIFKLCEGFNFYNALEKNKVYYLFKKLGVEAYQIGDLMMLELLKTIHPEKAIKIEDFIIDLSNTDRRDLSKEDIYELLALCMRVDLSMYVQAILNNQTLNGDDAFPKDQFFRCCAIIQNESPNAMVSSFAQNIGACGHNKDSKMFIALLKDLLGYKMETQELVDNYKMFSEKKHDEDVYVGLQIKAEQLMLHALNQGNEVAIWALTYLFDEQDYIHDELPILGWQDDWMVLDAAVKMLS